MSTITQLWVSAKRAFPGIHTGRRSTASSASAAGNRSQGLSSAVTVAAGERIPFDGEVVDGFALVDESAFTGVSSPVIIEPAPGRNTVIADTLVVDGKLTIRPQSGRRS